MDRSFRTNEHGDIELYRIGDNHGWEIYRNIPLDRLSAQDFKMSMAGLITVRGEYAPNYVIVEGARKENGEF